MALPIRSIPVLEGEVAERFLREARKAEKGPPKYKITEEMHRACRKANEDLRKQFSAERGE